MQRRDDQRGERLLGPCLILRFNGNVYFQVWHDVSLRLT
jgi:hypothetical protein